MQREQDRIQLEAGEKICHRNAEELFGLKAKDAGTGEIRKEMARRKQAERI